MNKLLSLFLLIGPLAAKAQLPASEQRKYDRQHDSMQTVITRQRIEIDAKNDAYLRQHPNYLRQHPEVLRAHPEYRTRYAKYLGGRGKK